MVERSSTIAGEGYRATPIVEPWGDAGWKAGVLLSGGDARGDRPAKSLGTQLFASRETPGYSQSRSTARSAATDPSALARAFSPPGAARSSARAAPRVGGAPLREGEPEKDEHREHGAADRQPEHRSSRDHARDQVDVDRQPGGKRQHRADHEA